MSEKVQNKELILKCARIVSLYTDPDATFIIEIRIHGSRSASLEKSENLCCSSELFLHDPEKLMKT